VYYDGFYAPFGESNTLIEMGTIDHNFTGQTQDMTSGLYDFTFRQHSSSQGRWLVPDPAGMAAVDITNPQTWNRYATSPTTRSATLIRLGLIVRCIMAR
jgi:RHS repeat-associated protein